MCIEVSVQQFPLFLILTAALAASACSASTSGSAETASTAKAAAARQTIAAAVDLAAAPQPVIEAIRKLAPKAQIQSVDKTPLPDLWQVIVQGQPIYLSSDGRYMLQGVAYDLKTGDALADERLDRMRRDALAAIPPSQMIRFAPARPKYTVTIFTDVDCPYCRVLHAQIADYNKAGIAVNYLFWPRSGPDTPSYYKAVSVWCATDRNRSFTTTIAGADPKPSNCANPVKHDFDLGVDLGVDGTPTIIASNGALLNGYAAPDQLLQWLKQSPAPKDGG